MACCENAQKFQKFSRDLICVSVDQSGINVDVIGIAVRLTGQGYVVAVARALPSI